MVEPLIEGVLLVSAGAALMWLVYQALSFTDAHAAYVRGDALQVEKGLAAADLPTRIALLTALGRYQEALAVAGKEPAILGEWDDLTSHALLARINAAEAVAELGRFDEALRLLDLDTSDEPFLDAGRRNARAWTLSLAGRDQEALELIEQSSPALLGRQYEAEGFLTWALILLNLGRGEAGQKLAACRERLARASSERNLLLLEARWHALHGRMAEAEEAFQRGRDHSWKRQGATSYLLLGDAFLCAGAAERARECWTLAAERDPEAFAAKTCKERLASQQARADRQAPGTSPR